MMNPLTFEELGAQPIRVFNTQFERLFEEIKREFLNKYPGEVLKNIKLSFLTENIKAIGPKVNQSRMQFHDTFLSFLWCYCYGLSITTPMRDKPFQDTEVRKARDLLKYSNEIMFNAYTPWPTVLPNPENIEDHNKEHIGKVNAIFLGALQIILFHEFSHIILGHVELNETDIQKRRQMEFDADEFSIQTFITHTAFGEMTKNIAIICAISSLSFGNIKNSNKSFHPEPEDRLTKILEYLNYPDNSFLWGQAWWAFIEWQIYFGWFYNPDENAPIVSSKNSYYSILKDFKAYKLLNS